jgi:hypothetical protein
MLAACFLAAVTLIGGRTRAFDLARQISHEGLGFLLKFYGLFDELVKLSKAVVFIHAMEPV